MLLWFGANSTKCEGNKSFPLPHVMPYNAKESAKLQQTANNQAHEQDFRDTEVQVPQCATSPRYPAQKRGHLLIVLFILYLIL